MISSNQYELCTDFKIQKRKIFAAKLEYDIIVLYMALK